MGWNNSGKSKESIQKKQSDKSIAEQTREFEMQQIQAMQRMQQQHIQELQRKIQMQYNQLTQMQPQKVEVYQKSEPQQKVEVHQQSEPQQKIEVRQQSEAQQKVEVYQQSEPQQKVEVYQKSEPQQKFEARQRTEPSQKMEAHQHLELQKKVDEKKKDEFQTLVKQHQNEAAQQTFPSLPKQRACEKPLVNEKVNESKQQIQQELLECSRTIRDIQRTIKETYQFKPCRQLCEVLINIRQNVYKKVEDIQEDLGYVIEAFGIDEFVPKTGDIFEAKCHDQVYSNIQDARGKEIERVYSSGFMIDGEVIVKAQVSVK